MQQLLTRSGTNSQSPTQPNEETQPLNQLQTHTDSQPEEQEHPLSTSLDQHETSTPSLL